MKTKVLLSVLFSFSFYLLSSQVPQGFNYQAIARDGSGNPIGGATIKVRLSLLTDTLGFRAGTGGAYVWEEEHIGVVTNAYGLFNIVLGTGSRVQGVNNFGLINWSLPTLYLGTKIANPSTYKPLGGAKLWSVPYSMYTGNISGSLKKLTVKGESVDGDSILFEVRNKRGQTVFAVYNEGVRIYVADGDSTTVNSKGKTKGGFAIGGFGSAKTPSQEYLRVTRDSTRVYVNPLAKGATKGGFAIGGFAGKGSENNFLNLTKENYFIGQASGSKNTTGTYNSFFGFEAGKVNTTGQSNVFIGYMAGWKNTIGTDNLFIGKTSGYNNINGTNNIFLGVSSGYSNTGGVQAWMGSDNMFFGTGSGTSNTTGGSNIFIGTYAGFANITGNLNTYIGNNSGRQSTGMRNLFIGSYTGYDNSSGEDNLFIGNQTGEHSTIGGGNTFLGGTAGWYNGNGNGNTYLGLDAGRTTVGGSMNVFVGKATGLNSTAGSRNVYLGTEAGSFNSGSDNIFIGYQAGSSESSGNRLYIDNSNADKNNALIYGEFDNNKLRFNGNVGVNTDPGAFKFYTIDLLAFNDNPAILGQHSVTAYYGVGVKGVGGYIGVMGESTFAGTDTRYGVYGNASGGGANYGIYGTASGTGAYAGYFAGTVYATGKVYAEGLQLTSDKNLKRNVLPISGSLQKVMNLQGVTYEWKSEAELKSSGLNKKSGSKESDTRSFNFPKGLQIGVIAQDVEKILPELVQTDADGLKSVDYIKMIPLLIEAIKDQQKQIDDLKAMVITLSGQAKK
jgi:trimeric autotransporter adhesin